jgi:uncharacterized protein DUF2190
MSVQNQVFDIPMQVSPNAGTGINQFRAVVQDVAGGSGPFDGILASSTSAPILGINQTMGNVSAVGVTTPPNATLGQSIAVRQLGISKAEAGGAITQGQYVAVNASGQLVAIASIAPAATATSTFAVGIALTPATAATDYFTVLLMPWLTTLVTS